MLQIGEWRLHIIDSGRFKLDGGAMFGVIPQTIWKKTNPPDEQNRILLALRCLLIENGKTRILVDTGIGTKFSEKEKQIYGVDHSLKSMDKALANIGLKSSDITDVLITHLHFDHAGGNTKIVNNNLQPVFENATYHVDKFHYEWAQNPSRRDRASFFSHNYEFLHKLGKLNLFDGGNEKIFPQITTLKVHGHTPHLCLPKISDGKTHLLYCADLIPTSSHIPLPFIMGYDLNALQTLSEKEIILELVHKEDWILFFEHDPDFSCARIEKTDKNDYRARERFEL